MNNLINLTNIYIRQMFNQTFSARKKGKFSTLFFTLVIALIVFVGLGYSYYSMGKSFVSLGEPEMILLMGLISASIFVLFFTIYQQQGVYFKTKDYDFLASLPIKTSTIVFAKFLSSYALSLLYNFIFSLPAFVVYFIFNKITAVGIIYSFISLMFTPAFIVLIGNLLTILISLATFKLKNKNIVNSIISLIFSILVILFVVFASNDAITNFFASGEISIWFRVLLPSLPFLFESVVTTSFLPFLFFLLISFASIILSVLFLTLTYKKINNIVLGVNSKSGKKTVSFKTESVSKALIKKEFRTIVNSPIYFLNTLSGAILSVVFAVVFGIMFKGEDFVEFKSLAVTIFAILMVFMTGVAPTSSVGINVEGENIYILRSLPIKFTTLAFAKILFSILIYLPFYVVSNILFFSILQPTDVWLIAISLVLQLVGIVMSSTLGLLINLKFPKVNWINMTQAIKQSMSVFIVVIIDFAIALVPLLLSTSLAGVIMSAMPLSAYLAILLGIYLIIFIISLVLLKKTGEKLFLKI